ncbi:hypothetical protein A4U53_035110 (plasmid) [Rhizobium ruizarguesonis]|uniref:Uncharacterized protein n=1 Tax=Rhizobium ruizarguesonis TaxID=2081791 RepID=A0ACD5EV65_9HYPH
MKFNNNLPHNNLPIDGIERGRIRGDRLETEKSVHHGTLVTPMLTAGRSVSQRGAFVEVDTLPKSICIYRIRPLSLRWSLMPHSNQDTSSLATCCAAGLAIPHDFS